MGQVMDDEIEIPIRLDDDVALKLAMFAHSIRRTMNEVVVDILATTAYGWELRRRGSRRGREGAYVGKWRGQHLRSTSMVFNWGGPRADVAWAVASQRAGAPQPVRKPRYG